MTRAPIKGRGVSMVFQSFALYPHLTVYGNLAYPLIEQGVPRSETRKRVRETAEMLQLEHRLDRKPATLSGGEQQRVALGRSLVGRPRILLLDEPLTNLDAKLRHEMRAELKRLHRQFGMTIVYATPDELEALSMGEEIAVMRDGRVVQQGTPDELYEHAGRHLCRVENRLAAHEYSECGRRRDGAISLRPSGIADPLRRPTASAPGNASSSASAHGISGWPGS